VPRRRPSSLEIRTARASAERKQRHDVWSMQYRQARSSCMCICQRLQSNLSGDGGLELYDAAGMDERSLRLAALVTLRRAICVRALPGGTGAASVAYLGGDRPRPRGLGRATATTSATFLPH